MTLLVYIVAVVISDAWLFVPSAKRLPEAREVRR